MKRKAIYLLYRVLLTVLAPPVLLYFLARGLRQPRYFSTLRQRTGELPALWQKTAAGVIWLHAVSVGEVLAALPLMAELRRRLPRAPIYLSTATLAGYETAQKRAAELAEGVFYAPLDYVWAVRRVLRRLRPSVVVVMETEIWPNLYRESKRVGCGLALVNGRISDRALPRYRKYAGLFGPVLGWCDRILTQSEEMRQRFLEAGAPEAATAIAGNLKYDFQVAAMPEDSPIRRFLQGADGRVWVAASTSSDGILAEEDFALAAQRELRTQGWRLVVAPRKPERFAEIAAKLAASGLRWTARTALHDTGADTLLLDSVGELASVFPYCHAVLMGGTLAAMGGHNILEPAVAGKPVVAGPHLENFRDIERHFESRHAVKRIGRGEEIAQAIRDAAEDPALGERGRNAAREQTGAAHRIAEEIVRLHSRHYPLFRPVQPGFAMLWVFARIWEVASARDRRRKRARRRSLPVPVVSVGNVTTGGTGKTPMVIALLNAFAAAKPALLTRGHGRGAPGIVTVRAGHHSTTDSTGDEPQLIRRATCAPMAIGADRYRAGLHLLESVTAGMLVLDDGFQHLQLARDFDLVVIDGLNPFGGGELVPLGRLREPLEGLGRAHAFVITRTDEVANVAAIEHVLRLYNRTAPVFAARTRPRAWRNVSGEQREPAYFSASPSLAFCGLGNPNAFWGTLAGVGIVPLETYAFEDHHRYRPVELRRLYARACDIGAEFLLTTEKDAVNIADPAENVYWLEIELEVERMAELTQCVIEYTT